MPSTKERILASAMRLLDTGGPDAVTLRAVGEAAGISQSAPYRHYENKRALLEAMVRANLDYLNAAFEKAEHDASSPFGVLDRTVRAYFDFARRFPVRYRFLLEISREDTPLGSDVRQAFAVVNGLVRAAQQAGALADGDPEQIAALIFGAACGMAAQFNLANAAARGAAVPDPPPDLAPLMLDLLAKRPSQRNG
jgi:AcrR family transcriptional regulator